MRTRTTATGGAEGRWEERVMARHHHIEVRATRGNAWKSQAKVDGGRSLTKGKGSGGGGATASRGLLGEVEAVRPADAPLRGADELDDLADGGELAEFGLHAEQ